METSVISASEIREVPEHFPHESVRPLQKAAIHAIDEAWERGYRYVFLEAPTGFGKSAVAITLAKQHPKAFILVSTKVLQDQYSRRRIYGTVQVKGQSNFGCLLSKTSTCNAGQCHLGTECKHKPSRSTEDIPVFGVKIAETEKVEFWAKENTRVCRYWKQKCYALGHSYPVMNYSYFLHETTHAKDFMKRKLMICDEAHSIEKELMNFISFSISDNDLKLVNCRIPKEDIPIKEWVKNLKEWARNMTIESNNTEEKANRAGKERISNLIEKINELNSKIRKCEFISEELTKDPENWLIDRKDKDKVSHVTFKPIFVKSWGHKFFDFADLFLLQSATIIDADAIAKSLKLPQEECIFLRAGSEFDPKKRPIYYNPIGRMSMRHIEDTLPKLADEIRLLMTKYPTKKGVIHTHSYRIQDYILQNIQTDRFIANKAEDSKMREGIFQEFIESKKPLILVTPSAYEGMDFKDDICRWQVLCKIPYPDLGDKQIHKRNEIDQSWYQWMTILRLVQTYGRGIRSKTDWCRTYLFDASFDTLYGRSKKLFPEWFTEAIVPIR
ncbi:MAG: DEAD/DEAH box helicase family protein [Candidatus Aenigmarchaeota archaeon]|nr:DEAD/DEAH box helicase family protein [Candidatus Aenigmarchaeota archaeon]